MAAAAAKMKLFFKNDVCFCIRLFFLAPRTPIMTFKKLAK